MTVTSAPTLPSRIAADSPPNPAPIITMCGRSVAVEPKLSSAVVIRSKIPSISSPHRARAGLRKFPGSEPAAQSAGREMPGATHGDCCERDYDEAEPGAEAEALGHQADHRRAQKKTAIPCGRYRGDPDAGRHGGELSGGAEKDRHGIGKPQPDRGKPEQHYPWTAGEQSCGQERSGNAGARTEHPGSPIAPYRPVPEKTPRGHSE